MDPLDDEGLGGSDEDRISELPDSLLHHILYFVSTKDATRTSILSQRWRNIWTLVPCLDLDAYLFSDERCFFNFMDRFLNLRGNACLQKFVVSNVSQYGSSRLRQWMDAAALCKVEHLHVGLKGPCKSGDVMLQSFFMCNTLVVLKLRHTTIIVPELVSLSNLKTMHLEEVIFKYAYDSDFKRLISGCPVLEDLRIIRGDRDRIKLLSICCQRLKRLYIQVDGFIGCEGSGIVIDAPHLEYLTLYDYLSESIVINNIGFPLEAHVSVSFNHKLSVAYQDVETGVDSKKENVSRFLPGIANVKSLIITAYTLRILSRCMGFKSVPQFNYLIHLETSFYEDGWKYLPGFLLSCPNLRTFILKSYHSPKSNPLRRLSTPRCLLSSLESITLKKIGGTAEEIGAIRYFLERSAVLKQMKVHLHKLLSGKKMESLRKVFLKSPKVSTACEVSVI